jgi:hypothetical protein
MRVRTIFAGGTLALTMIAWSAPAAFAESPTQAGASTAEITLAAVVTADGLSEPVSPEPKNDGDDNNGDKKQHKDDSDLPGVGKNQHDGQDPQHEGQGPPPHEGQGPPPHEGQGPPPHKGQGPPPQKGQGPPPHEGQGPHQGDPGWHGDGPKGDRGQQDRDHRSDCAKRHGDWDSGHGWCDDSRGDRDRFTQCDRDWHGSHRGDGDDRNRHDWDNRCVKDHRDRDCGCDSDRDHHGDSSDSDSDDHDGNDNSGDDNDKDSTGGGKETKVFPKGAPETGGGPVGPDSPPWGLIALGLTGLVGVALTGAGAVAEGRAARR